MISRNLSNGVHFGRLLWRGGPVHYEMLHCWHIFFFLSILKRIFECLSEQTAKLELSKSTNFGTLNYCYFLLFSGTIIPVLLFSDLSIVHDHNLT